MPERRRASWSGLAAALVVALWGGVAAAVPGIEGADLRDRMAALSDAMAQPANAALTARELLAGSGLERVLGLSAVPPAAPAAASPAADGAAPVDMQVLDLRLALAMLAQSHGAESNQAVVEAQSNRAFPALVVRQGTATLDDLRLFLQHYRLQDDIGGAELLLRVPVVVWDGAALALGPRDRLALSRPDGAFLLNFGTLTVRGATVAAVGPRNVRIGSFIPFVATAGAGIVQVDGGRFHGLGFGKTAKFSGFSLVRNALMAVRGDSYVRDSHFEDLISVTLHSATGVAIEGNRFQNFRGAPVIAVRSARTRVIGNLFGGLIRFNSISLSGGSARSVVHGNAVLGGEKVGIAVRNDSHGTVVTHNIVWRRKGGGIAYARSDCGVIADNVVMDNRQKGIEVRTSRDTQVRGNTIISNKSAGIWVSAQDALSGTFLEGNTLASNGSGVSTAVGGNLKLVGNDMRKQFPRFFNGDLVTQSRIIFKNLEGATPLILNSEGQLSDLQPSGVCEG
ncbi:hypothetical protein DXV76_08310 [Rhodobacteraceae bacterium CCMM004]|nr:hypothetical protein DXV76_08310 [Rhodobacteraceae bacterium CCMM004]